jgi:hypothetical protein
MDKDLILLDFVDFTHLSSKLMTRVRFPPPAPKSFQNFVVASVSIGLYRGKSAFAARSA